MNNIDQIKASDDQHHKLLIANRGEIACRIIRTAKHMGLSTVAVFSAADSNAPHVDMADEAVYIGPAPSEKSYLVIDNIIQAAQKTGATLIHPGYGFLSENPIFAARCLSAGIIFIGPTADAIATMSDKAAAKKQAEQLAIPVVSGYYPDTPPDAVKHTDAHSLKDLPEPTEADYFRAALKIGTPLIIKAIAGGGGKGMRLIKELCETEPNHFNEYLHSAQREAQSSFGNSCVMLEQYIENARHIEVQIIGDQFGNTLHLWDRDCSIQRRHQKIVEEAPADLDNTLRQCLLKDAIDLAQSIGYQGAGTVEFLVDINNNHYFLEMNTRLQVEHGVTEEITGIDLVEWQIRIALGEQLPLEQHDISCEGHAIEVRLNAENPQKDFLPATGQITHLVLPKDIRIETGIHESSIISIYYDANIAKFITWAATRHEAINLLQQALLETELQGVQTNLYFLQQLVRSYHFRNGYITTRFLEELNEETTQYISSPACLPKPEPYQLLAAASLFDLLKNKHAMTQVYQQTGSPRQTADDPYNPWSEATGWLLNAPAQYQNHLLLEGEYHTVTIREDSIGFEITHNGQRYHFKARTKQSTLYLEQHGHQIRWTVLMDAAGYTLLTGSAEYRIEKINFDREQEHDIDNNKQIATMPGAITKILVPENTTVQSGAPIMILEAMKMEHTLAAPADGHVAEYYFSEGDSVNEGDTLFQFTLQD